MSVSFKILIAPLDWGLGHTTRCIPLIDYLLREGHQVVVATEGEGQILLKENFPDIRVLPLRGYRIKYSRSKNTFLLRLLLQVPGILVSVWREHKWLRGQQREERFDIVISDNRYGLYHKEVASVILIHQLMIRSGWGRRIDNVLRMLHYRQLNRFNQCWVVDNEGAENLSGVLGHPKQLPERAVYLGLLSQFSLYMERSVAGHGGRGITRSGPDGTPVVLILLSGPEPMRSRLEEILLLQVSMLQGYRFILVAGKPSPGKIQSPNTLPHLEYHSHLGASALWPLLSAADLVVCRSGYSTLMDLAIMGKKALLIPTPGQTEQEYLAGYLTGKGYFHTRSQKLVCLDKDIPVAMKSRPFAFMHKQVVDRLDEVFGEFKSKVKIKKSKGR